MGSMKPVPPKIPEEFPTPSSSIEVPFGSMRVRISLPPIPEYPASDPEAEVTVTFATKLLLKDSNDTSLFERH